MKIISTIAIMALATTLTAGTSPKKEHPAQVIEIAKSIKTLLASEGGAFLTVSEPSTDKIVQVAKITEKGKTRLQCRAILSQQEHGHLFLAFVKGE